MSFQPSPGLGNGREGNFAIQTSVIAGLGDRLHDIGITAPNIHHRLNHGFQVLFHQFLFVVITRGQFSDAQASIVRVLDHDAIPGKDHYGGHQAISFTKQNDFRIFGFGDVDVGAGRRRHVMQTQLATDRLTFYERIVRREAAKCLKRAVACFGAFLMKEHRQLFLRLHLIHGAQARNARQRRAGS